MIHLLVASVHPFLQNIYIYISTLMKACDFGEAGELMLELKSCNSVSWLWMTSCFPWYDVHSKQTG